MHYGMTVVVINFLEQAICMNEWNEIQCKPLHLITKHDKTCFKLIDMNDPENPGITDSLFSHTHTLCYLIFTISLFEGPVKYGAPLWLQMVDPSGQADNSFQNGHILGAKVNTIIIIFILFY